MSDEKCGAVADKSQVVCCLDADHDTSRQTIHGGETKIVRFHTASNGYSWGEIMDGRCCSRCYYVETSATEEGWTKSLESKDVCPECSTKPDEPSVGAIVKDFLKSVFG